MSRHARRTDRPGYWLDRSVRRMWLWTCTWAAGALTFLFASVAQWTGLDPARDPDVANGGVLIAILAGVMAVGGAVRLRGLRATGPAGATPVARLARRAEKSRWLPRAGSRAREPIRRLANTEVALTEMLYQFDGSSDRFTVPDEWIVSARAAGADAAAELRAVAARLEAVEPAIEHAAPQDRDSLEAAVRGLREQLDGGVEAYGRLISAVCQVLIAGVPTAAETELADATDRLGALATALRELREAG